MHLQMLVNIYVLRPDSSSFHTRPIVHSLEQEDWGTKHYSANSCDKNWGIIADFWDLDECVFAKPCRSPRTAVPLSCGMQQGLGCKSLVFPAEH